MQKYFPWILPIGTLLVGVALGYCLANVKHDSEMTDSIYENYTDRGRICLEAAVMLRNNQPGEARKRLERSALGAIRGVPMGRAYDDLIPKSQELMVLAKRYDTSFADVDLEINRLTRGDVPSDHPGLSPTVRKATSGIGD